MLKTKQYIGRRPRNTQTFVFKKVEEDMVEQDVINALTLNKLRMLAGSLERSKEEMCVRAAFKRAAWAGENNVCQNRPRGNERHFERAQNRERTNWKVNHVHTYTRQRMCW